MLPINVACIRFALTTLVLSGGLLSVRSSGRADDSVRPGGLAHTVGKAQEHRDSLVKEVRSFRRYVLRNKGWKASPLMEVEMTWDGRNKKTYKVLHTTAKGFQKSVLLKVLDGEVAVAARGTDASTVSGDNYDFKPLGMEEFHGRPCRLVELLPKVRSRFIFDGRACVDLEDAAVVWLEGRTTKSVSFWVGRPNVRQEFERIGSFWFSSLNKSVADVKFLGETEMSIEYLDYVVTPLTGQPLLACKTECRAFRPDTRGKESSGRTLAQRAE